MNNHFVSLLSVAALAAFSAAPVMGQGQTDKPAGMVSASVTRTATVTKIDKEERWVTLKLADGSLVDIQAGPAVKNFDQIKVGDKVTARQDETVAIEVVPAGQAPPNVSGGSAVVTAPPGAKPMAVMVDKAMVSGKVTAIDHAARLVTLQGPAGKSHTIEVGPDVQKFNAMKAGDEVVMTLKTATTIEVTAPSKGAKEPKPAN
jgi:hypothetical protein